MIVLDITILAETQIMFWLGGKGKGYLWKGEGEKCELKEGISIEVNESRKEFL